MGNTRPLDSASRSIEARMVGHMQACLVSGTWAWHGGQVLASILGGVKILHDICLETIGFKDRSSFVYFKSDRQPWQPASKCYNKSSAAPPKSEHKGDLRSHSAPHY
jgi:hypothetical protein